MVNEILTGSFVAEQIVWRNNAENLGIRLGTTPIEDNIKIATKNIFWWRFRQPTKTKTILFRHYHGINCVNDPIRSRYVSDENCRGTSVLVG